jgi:hypothetical protein
MNLIWNNLNENRRQTHKLWWLMNLHFVPVITIIRFIWEWKVLASESGKWGGKKRRVHHVSRYVTSIIDQIRNWLSTFPSDYRVMWELYLYDVGILSLWFSMPTFCPKWVNPNLTSRSVGLGVGETKLWLCCTTWDYNS